MVTANTHDLSQMFLYEILSRVKGCEFNFLQYVEKHSKKLDGHNQNVFLNLANDVELCNPWNL